MQVEGGVSKNGTNIQQWGTTGDSVHDIWKLVETGDGYYYLISGVGDGNSFSLDIEGKSSSNGSNVVINESNNEKSQQFMIVKNSDGFYLIKTRISDNKSAVEIADSGIKSGDNVQHWTLNNSNNQNWILEEVVLLKNNKNNESYHLFKANKVKKKGKSDSFSVIRTEIFKDDECVHTVVYAKYKN